MGRQVESDEYGKPGGAQKLFLWCVLFVLLAVAGFLYDLPYLIYRTFNPLSPAEQVAQTGIKDPYLLTKHVRVAGVDYDIPMAYFRRMVPSYTLDTQIYLDVHRPDFGILPMNENRMWEQGKSEDMLRILSHDPAGHLSPTKMLPHRIEATGRTIINDKTLFGLSVYLLPEDAIDKKMGRLYTLSKDGLILTLIACSDKTSQISIERCTHFFTDGFLIHQTSYRYTRLSEWRDVEQGICSLFSRFRADAKKKNYGTTVIPDDKIAPQVFTQRNLDNKDNPFQGETSCR